MNKQEIAMSNETDLDWLVRNVHVWPKIGFFQGLDRPEGWRWVEVIELDSRAVALAKYEVGKYTAEINESQWIARRAELQNKPSWEDAPEWAQFLGQDEDGVWYWHGERPSGKGEDVNGQHYWMSRGISDIAIRGTLLGDWHDTLENRPEEFKPSIEEANRLAREFKPFSSIEDNQEQGMKQDNGWFDRGELPPVGLECEIIGAFGHCQKWSNCKIIAEHNGSIFAANECGWVNVKHGERKFRPIHTDRDVAIEDMVSVVCKQRHLHESIIDACSMLYDAGYRKEPK